MDYREAVLLLDTAIALSKKVGRYAQGKRMDQFVSRELERLRILRSIRRRLDDNLAMTRKEHAYVLKQHQKLQKLEALVDNGELTEDD